VWSWDRGFSFVLRQGAANEGILRNESGDILRCPWLFLSRDISAQKHHAEVGTSFRADCIKSEQSTQERWEGGQYRKLGGGRPKIGQSRSFTIARFAYRRQRRFNGLFPGRL
jgi:hypothetical protein